MRMGGSLTLSVRPANDAPVAAPVAAAPVAAAAPSKEEPIKRIAVQSQPLKRRPRLAGSDAKPKNNTSRGMRLGMAANSGKSEKKRFSGSRRLAISETNRGQGDKSKSVSRPRLAMAKPAEAAKKEEPVAIKPRARLGMAKK